MPSLDRYRRLTIACVAALAALSIAWEAWLAPLRPGGSLMVLKALPLLLVLPALVRGSVRAYQWWSMLILVYLCEGLVRGLSDPTPTGRWLGWTEAVLAGAAYGAILGYAHAARRPARRGAALDPRPEAGPDPEATGAPAAGTGPPAPPREA
jgi:uncharacterized membrane protein